MSQVLNWSNIRVEGLTMRLGANAGVDMQAQVNAILDSGEINGKKVLIEDIQFTTVAVFLLYRVLPDPPQHDS